MSCLSLVSDAVCGDSLGRGDAVCGYSLCGVTTKLRDTPTHTLEYDENIPERGVAAAAAHARLSASYTF